MNDVFESAYPKGWLGDRLRNITNPRKRRWNAYLRACSKIPKTSPVSGSTSWEKINARRLSLIEHRKDRDPVEFAALQDVAGQIRAPYSVAQLFILNRVVRRLKSNSSNSVTSVNSV